MAHCHSKYTAHLKKLPSLHTCTSALVPLLCNLRVFHIPSPFFFTLPHPYFWSPSLPHLRRYQHHQAPCHAKSAGGSPFSSHLTLQVFDRADHALLKSCFTGQPGLFDVLPHWLLLRLLCWTLFFLGSVLGSLPSSMSFRLMMLSDICLRTLRLIPRVLTCPLSSGLAQQSSQHPLALPPAGTSNPLRIERSPPLSLQPCFTPSRARPSVSVNSTSHPPMGLGQEPRGTLYSLPYPSQSCQQALLALFFIISQT